jgi:glycolate oxidase iron-sulfur subunit
VTTPSERDNRASSPRHSAEGATAGPFDSNHPPDRALIDKCVHCGFCLPSCPTYVLWGEEMDSPRGRIYLMEAGLDRRTPMSTGFVRHFDACLGCMACVTACPSGVQYSPLIEATRGQIERRYSRGLSDRMFRAAIFALFPYPGRLRFALAPLVLVGWAHGVARALRRLGRSSAEHRQRSETKRAGSGRAPELAVQFKSLTFERKRRVRGAPLQGRQIPPGNGFFARLRALLELAPDVTVKSLVAHVPARTPAAGARRLTVGLLTGCVQRIAFPRVNDATVRVLAAEGCDVLAPPEQGCCGALALHAGRLEEARAFARRTIDVFERAGVEAVAVNAAGCGSSMKEYGQLLADDAAWAERARAFSAKVRDVSQILAEIGPPQATRHPLNLRVAYHDACHLAHAQGVRQPPRDLLHSIPGIELLPIAEQEICCGSAGIYNLVEPATGRELGDRKAGFIDATRPDVVATSNPGCMLQIAAAAERRGRTWTIRHPIEILDASIRGVDVIGPRT